MNKLIFLLLLLLLFYTRFVNLGWGLPYPFHPDERNMAAALQQLSCPGSQILDFRSLINCFNPHFFAYGQLPLYLGYILIKAYQFFFSSISSAISFSQAVISLRVISALASVINVFVMMKIVELITKSGSLFEVYSSKSKLKSHPELDSGFRFRNKFGMTIRDFWASHSNSNILLIALPIFIFSSGLIQMAHFGTTESLLTFIYSLVIYLSLLFLKGSISFWSFIKWSATFCGLAFGIKVSSLIFLIIPAVLIITAQVNKESPLMKKIRGLSLFFGIIIITAVLTSPFNLIAYNDFLSSMRYESAVAMGNFQVFYTRQFFETIPVIFQVINIFPYALGWVTLILFSAGFLILPYTKNYNLLRLAFLIYFLFNAFLFAKWTRFMAPIFPVMLVISVLFLLKIGDSFMSIIKNSKFQIPRNKQISKTNLLDFTSFRSKNMVRFRSPQDYCSSLSRTIIWTVFIFWCLVIGILVIPGVAYLSVYNSEDVRIKASRWIYSNIPNNSYILSESGNVVDIPFTIADEQLPAKVYNYASFNYYDLEDDSELKKQLGNYLEKSRYIFIPSRRVFANHTCFKAESEQDRGQRCNLLQKNYPNLNYYYSNLFSGNFGFRKIIEFSSYPKISLFNKTFIEFKDEQAEETWSVFDHPVIRIYQRQKS